MQGKSCMKTNCKAADYNRKGWTMFSFYGDWVVGWGQLFTWDPSAQKLLSFPLLRNLQRESRDIILRFCCPSSNDCLNPKKNQKKPWNLMFDLTALHPQIKHGCTWNLFWQDSERETCVELQHFGMRGLGKAGGPQKFVQVGPGCNNQGCNLKRWQRFFFFCHKRGVSGCSCIPHTLLFIDLCCLYITLLNSVHRFQCSS